MTPSFTHRTAIVDAHAHLYDGGANHYGIFARKDPGFEAFVGDYSALPRTYLLDDYLRATSSRKVDGLIWHEFISKDPIKEVTWAQRLAAASEVPIALVGLVDFRDPDLRNAAVPRGFERHSHVGCAKSNSLSYRDRFSHASECRPSRLPPPIWRYRFSCAPSSPPVCCRASPCPACLPSPGYRDSARPR